MAADGQTSTATETSKSEAATEAAKTEAATTDATNTDAADPLSVIPEKADGYAFGLSEKAQALVGDLKNDPAVLALQTFALEQKWSQGQFNTLATALDVLAEKGLIEAPIDQAAELGKLGTDGEQRQKGLETYLQALQSRQEIDGDMYAEAMMLTRTAAGVKVLELFKKAMPEVSFDVAGGQGSQTGDAAKDAWRERRLKPEYESDPNYKKQIDREFQEIWGKA